VERRGIVVTQEEVQQQIERSFGYDSNPAAPEPTVSSPLTPTDALTPTEDPLPTPTPMTEESFRQLYTRFLSESLKPLDISEDQYRSWLEGSLLIEKLQEQMAAEVPFEADQVAPFLLFSYDEMQANALLARLESGEDFQTLADELNENEATDAYAIELEWVPKDLLEIRLGAEIAELAFGLEVGEYAPQLTVHQDEQGSTQYIIVKVMGRGIQEIDPWVRQQLAEGNFQDWFEAQQFLVERRTYQDRVPTTP
jgi:hypothetical protein